MILRSIRGDEPGTQGESRLEEITEQKVRSDAALDHVQRVLSARDVAAATAFDQAARSAARWRRRQR